MAASWSSTTILPASPPHFAFQELRSAMSAEPLRSRIRPLPESPYSGDALQHLGEAAERQDAGPVLDAILAEPGLAAFLGSALGDCPFLLDLAAKDVSRLAAILGEGPETR